MDTKDTEAAAKNGHISNGSDDEKVIGGNGAHNEEVVPDPDGHLGAEERAAIVCFHFPIFSAYPLIRPLRIESYCGSST